MKRFRLSITLPCILLVALVLYAHVFLRKAIEKKGSVIGSDEREQVGRSNTYTPHKIRASATESGAWKLPDGYEYYFDEALASAMVQHFWKERKAWGRPNVLEFGSGTGKYITYFRANRIKFFTYNSF